MSPSTLRRLLVQLLGRFLNLNLLSIRRLSPFKFIDHLFVFLSSIRRWTRSNTPGPGPTLHKNQEPLIRLATLDSGIVYAMNVPSAGLSDAQENVRPSPVDLPYINSRSPSGNHLTAAISPTPKRSYSRDHMSWMTSNQTPLFEEPSLIDEDAASIVQSSLSTINHTEDRNPRHSSDIFTQPSRPQTPPHTIVGFQAEASHGNTGIDRGADVVHAHFNPTEFDPRSRTPLSTISSAQRSISQKSHRSGMSIGRASYREHRGPLGRPLTLVHDRSTPASNSSSYPTLVGAQPGLSAPPGSIIAPPRADDPRQPGDPVCGGLRFFPMSTSGVLRYESRKIRSPFEDNYNIEAVLYQYPDTPEGLPEEWTAYRHPEGALYFVHQQSQTFTEVDVCDEDIHGDIEFFRTYLFSELESEIKNRGLTESLNINKVQLVLEPKMDEIGVMCCYYFVNPRTRSLFWLDEWNGHEIFRAVKGILSSAHKGLAIQAHYWWMSHWNLYPNFCEVTQELKDEAIDMILHATCDHLTSNLSSLPLNPEELKNHLSLIKQIDPFDLKRAHRHGHRHGHYAVIMGRIMNIFYENYFLNFHGEDCARLNFDQAVHGWRYHPSPYMTILAPLLFMTPVDNVRLLHRVFVDNTASKEKWNMFISRLNSQLQETSVLATVLLNADVGFLQVLTGNASVAAQYLCYISLVTSMASIILGLVFIGYGRTEERNTPFKAAKFLHELRHKKHGLEKLAIIYSLPHALLMWGMIIFSAAFAAQWCSPIDTISRSLVGVFMLIVTLLVAWCIWTVRDRCRFWWFRPDPDQMEYEEEVDDRVSSIIQKLGFFRRLMTRFAEKIRMTKSVSDEICPMEEVTTHHAVSTPTVTVTEPVLTR